MTRITYEPADGSRAATGVEAVARALEHIHLGWALLGFLLRLPIICQLAQLLADASGAEPRRIRPAGGLSQPSQMAHDQYRTSSSPARTERSLNVVQTESATTLKSAASGASLWNRFLVSLGPAQARLSRTQHTSTER